MNMKLIYVAGPFRGSDSWAVACNVHKAAELSLRVWKLGAACICPHLNTAQFQGALPDSTWLAGDIEILRRCDAVIATPDFTRSTGAYAEVAFANANGIPCFGHLETLEEWLQVQVEVDASRKTQAEREKYFNPRLGPMLEESLRDGEELKRRMEENWRKAPSSFI